MGFNVDTASFLRVEADEELFLGIRQEVAAYVASANKNHKGVLIVKFIFYASLLAGGYWLVFEVQSFYWLLVLYVSIGFVSLQVKTEMKKKIITFFVLKSHSMCRIVRYIESGEQNT